MTGTTEETVPAGDTDDPVQRRLGPLTGSTLVAPHARAVPPRPGAARWTLGNGQPPVPGSANVRFLHDMRTHHEEAIQLSQIQLANGTQGSIKVFAEEIVLSQSYETGRMEQLAAGSELGAQLVGSGAGPRC
jgi:hypothetical protein